MSQPFKYYITKCHKIAKKKGFWDKDRNFGEALMLIVSELGEAIEAYRKEGLGSYEVKDSTIDELADTFIRLFDLCGGLEIDIERQIKWKLNFNKSREKLHGKKF